MPIAAIDRHESESASWDRGPVERIDGRAGDAVLRTAGSRLGEPLLTPSTILGYRMWTLGVGSVVGLHGHPWAASRITAECLLRRREPRSGAPHLGPSGACPGRCGINAYRTPAALVAAAHHAPVPRRLATSSPNVGLPIPEGFYGAVALSGTVIEHEHGYRAERASVVNLVFVHGLEVYATRDPLTIAAQFPNPAGARRRFEVHRSCRDAALVPDTVVDLLVPTNE